MFKIRKATKDDIDAISQIYSNIHDAEERGELEIGWSREIYPTRKTAEDALFRDDLFVLDQDGKIIASAIFNHTPMPEYYEKWPEPCDYSKILVMHTLVVDPKYHHRGIGQQFTSYFEHYAIMEEGCDTLRLDTQAKNKKARQMYRKLGYTEEHETTCTFNGIEGRRLIILEKKL